MSEIRIEAKPIPNTGNIFSHMYLVYVDDNGNEFVIRGGPANDDLLKFGKIVTEIGVPIANSEDNRPLNERATRGSQVLDLGGRDAEDVWDIMLQQAKQIQAANIDYGALKNSNSTIASVLHVIGINIYEVTPDQPNQIDAYPGVNSILDEFSFKLLGTDQNDILVGGSNNDIIDGGKGNDELTGGAGDDIFLLSQGNDIILDSDPGDRLYIRTNLVGPNPDTDPSTPHDEALPLLGGFYRDGDQTYAYFIPQTVTTAPYDQSTDVIDFEYQNIYSEGYNFIADYEIVQVGQTQDLIVTVEYYDENTDELLISNSVTIKEYETGDFGITFSEDILDGISDQPEDIEEIETDLVTYNIDALLLTNNAEKLQLVGLEPGQAQSAPPSPPPPTVPSEGTSGDDYMPGTIDDDIIKGGAGDDTITGGTGDDILEGGPGADSLDGGDGLDTVSYEGATAGVYVHLLDVYQGTGDALGDTFVSIENILGSDHDDTFIATNEDNIVVAGLGDDAINGLAGNDTLYGNDGNDTIYGDEGDDFLFGGEGDDIVFGYEDNDQLILGNGDDYAIGGTGNDTVYGEAGEDEIYGHEGNDILIGGADDDLLFGDEGDDLIDVGTGDDFAVGGTGNDTFVFRADFGGNIISDFEAGAGASDVIEFESSSGLTSYSEVQAIMTEWQGTTYIELDANNYITLTDVAMSSLDQDDFRFVA